MGTKTIKFDNDKKARLGMVDYYDCWEDLRHKLGKYLEEKKRRITN